MAFDITSVFADVPKSGTELQNIHIDRLRADGKNFFRVEDTGIEELAASIECVGLQQPLQVRPDEEDGYYIVITGHRRMAALRLLAEEGKSEFAEVPCMVVENGSEALNELRLIYGNANTRQLSSYELSKMAERVQELFYQLKEEGMEFPGRMRDHVAEACQISKSKLSRLKVINEHLEIFVDLWQAGKLAEATAYELAQCDVELQWRIRDAKVKGEKLEAAKVKRVREAWEQGARWDMSFVCTPTGKDCGHGDVALRHDLLVPSWEGLCKGEQCCLTCRQGGECGLHTGPCDRMCKVAAEKRQAKKDAAAAEEAKAEEKRRSKVAEEFRQNVKPYVEAARAAGLADDVKLNMQYVSFTVGALAAAYENPEGFKEQWVFRNPNAADLKRMAGQLGCSVDWLLGLSEVMKPSQPAAPTAISEGEPSWQTGEPQREGRYWCRLDFHDGFEPWMEDLMWTGEKWKGLSDSAEVIGWWPLPEG